MAPLHRLFRCHVMLLGRHHLHTGRRSRPPPCAHAYRLLTLLQVVSIDPEDYTPGTMIVSHGALLLRGSARGHSWSEAATLVCRCRAGSRAGIPADAPAGGRHRVSCLEPLDEGAGTESASTSSSADAASLAGLASTLSRSRTQVCRTVSPNSSHLASISSSKPSTSIDFLLQSFYN